MAVYDTIIIGAGPAGLSAAIYAARQKINFVVLTGDIGGQTVWSTEVENYLGVHLVTGEQLVQKFEEHLKDYNIDVRQQEKVQSIKKSKKKNIFDIKTNKGTYQTKTIIISSGKQPRYLNVPGEKEFYGKGYRPHLIDRIGAGDAYDAGILYGYLSGDLEMGLAYGEAMSALKFSIPGDFLITTKEEIEAFIQQEQILLKR